MAADAAPKQKEPRGDKNRKSGQPHDNDGARADEFRGLFLTPLENGFRREVVIDQTGDRMTIYYMAPGKTTRLASRTAMERYLKNNPTLELSAHNFCWQKLILGFNDPDRETIYKTNPKH